ncbi:hypothetical protein IMSAG013_01534 [Clostridiales bacterium]|nr:hypothetical protein IMSAG013_01534 [Clostridiales bacterium]
MPYCSKCGAQFEGIGTYCPSCGGKASSGTSKDAFKSFSSEINSVADHTNSFDKKDIERNKGISVLSYLGFLFLVPYFAAQKSKFARFHAKQGMVLFIFEFAVNVIMAILKAIFNVIYYGTFTVFTWIRIPNIILTSVHSLLGLAALALTIVGIINVVQGKAKELPVIGKFAPKQ